MKTERKNAMKCGIGYPKAKSKKNEINDFWSGIGSLFGVVSPVCPDMIMKTIYYSDSNAISSDWKNIGNDVRIVIKRAEEEECV